MIQIQQKNNIIILRYSQLDQMNRDLDPISDPVDGTIVGRTGHNFPIECIPSGHWLKSRVKDDVLYVIAYCGSDTLTLNHELLHARYHLDLEYRRQIQRQWEELSDKRKSYICRLLGQMGYKPSVWIDEWQAYHFSEHLFGY